MGLAGHSNKPISELTWFLAYIKQVFLRAHRLYTRSVSHSYYVRKPRIYERRSTRTKRTSYLEIVSEMPQAYPSNTPEYIVVAVSVPYRSRVSPYIVTRRLHYILSRMEELGRLTGDKHFFIYILCNKATRGAYREVRSAWRRNTIVRILRYTQYTHIMHDIGRYLESRINGLLKPHMYTRSNGYIYSYPKRLLEYMLILNSLLENKPELAEHIAYIARTTHEYQVAGYREILENIRTGKIRTRETRTSVYTPYI